MTEKIGSVTHSTLYFSYNSYYLVDRYDNVTFGYSNAVSPTTPQNIGVTFANQLAGRSGYDVSFPGYETDVEWTDAGGMPSGTYPFPLTVDYSDPEWGTGSVTKTLTLSFVSGVHSALINQQDYDARFGVNDGTWPMTISPGASGAAISTTTDARNPDPSQQQIPRRLNFQIVTGTSVPLYGEVLENPHNVWALADPQSTTYVVSTTQPEDPHLETSDPGRMRLSVVDATGAPVTDIAFQVHNCPRYDHEGPPNQPTQTGRSCADAVVQSAGGVIASYSINQAGASRGYMGIELLRAPTNPGTYYIKIESLDGSFRIHQLPGLAVDETAAGEFKGAFALCVVQAGEFLDANFQRVARLSVRQPTQAYVRVVDPSSTASTKTLAVHAFDNTPTEFGSPVSVTLNRLGASTTYLGPITLLPDGGSLLQAHRTSMTQSGPAKAVPACTGRLVADEQSTQWASAVDDINCKLLIEFVDKADPNGPARAEQFTEIEDKAHNYAEKTYLRVSVVNPNKNNEVIANTGLTGAWLREISLDGTNGQPSQSPATVFSGHDPDAANPNDNNEAQGGDVLDAPGLHVDMQDGLSQPSPNESALVLRAIARRRTAGGTPLGDFFALVYAESAGPLPFIDPSEPLPIQMWVDQVDYFPRALGLRRHSSMTGIEKTSIDWIEKEALDVLASPRQGEADAFNSVETVWSDGYDSTRPGLLAVTGAAFGCGPTYVSPSDLSLNHRIHMNPFTEGLRWGYLNERAAANGLVLSYFEAGMKYNVGPSRFVVFENVITHEARHSLQNKVNAADLQTNDTDKDRFVASLSGNGVTLSGSERMLDSPSTQSGGLNPEFNLHGNDASSPSIGVDCYSSKQANERDAILNARSFTNGAFQLAGVTPDAGDLTFAAGTEGWFNLAQTLDRALLSGPQSSFLFWGNLAYASVTAGGCMLSDGVPPAVPGAAAIVSVITNRYQIYLKAPNTPGSTCTIALTPYIPTDGNGAPLTQGTPQNFTILLTSQ